MRCVFTKFFLLLGVSFTESEQILDPYQTDNTSFLAISIQDINSDIQIPQSKCNIYTEGTIELLEEDKVHDNLEEWWFANLQIYSEIGTHYAAQWAFIKQHLEDIPSIQYSFAFYAP